jgi:hypothetical protein
MTASPAKQVIHFAGGSPWGAYSQAEMLTWAHWKTEVDLSIRVLFAALGRHDREGHARFAPKELSEILGTVDFATGERRAAHPSSVSRAIGKARGIDLIAESSNAKCLVLPRYRFQKAFGSSALCRYH